MARLRIVQVNDVYALDRLPRLATLIRRAREVDPADRLLVVVAGDFLAPSLLSSIDAGRGAVDVLNALPLTHAILGNHEDDLAPAELRARLRELRAVVLLTNVHGFDDAHPRADVVEVGDRRVGLVGVTSAEASLYRRPPFGGARVDDANASAIDAARALVARGCDAVLAITHQRVAHDRALAAGPFPFPLVLGGHEHDGLVERIGDTWLVKAPSDALAAVVSELEWPADGGPLQVRAAQVPVDDLEEDPAVRARVDHHLAQVHALEAATVLLLAPGERLSSEGARSRATSMGTLLCSRLRDAFGADGAVLNGGGIRGDRAYEGRLTFGDLEREVPFEAEVSLAALPGHVLAAAVAASRAHAPAESGGFLQLDDRMAVGADGRLAAVAGAPLDPERTYRIALPRPLFEGMDRIAPLVAFGVAHPEAVPPVGCGRSPKVALYDAFAEVLWRQLGGLAGIDRDRDGVATPGEVAAALARADGRPATDAAADRLVVAHDRDGSGTITRGEAP